MQSLTEDLRWDSTMFSTMLTANEYNIRMIDTLVDILDNKSSKTGHIYFPGKKYYYCCRCAQARYKNF